MKSPTVLVVEDEVLIRMAIADYLNDCGFGVVEAASAKEALVIFACGRVPIDAVFTDVDLPGEMNGFGLARWVRENRQGVKVVVTSGIEHKAANAHELCQEGPLLRKPYQPQEVERRIKLLLNNS